MKRVALACLAAGVAGVCGCEVILGMDGHDAHLASVAPSRDAGGVPDAAVPPCVLPSTGDATLRVGNFVPSTARVDICLSRSGTASPLDGKPVLASARGTCPAGIGYKDVTLPFKIESGAYGVTLVPAGSACSAAPLATAQVTIAASGGAGVYLLGDGSSPPSTLALHEESPLGEALTIRFINAIAGSSAFDFGLATKAPPLTLRLVFSSDVTFGSVGTAAGDANGYAQITILGGSVPFGVAPTGSTSVALVADPILAASDGYSAFAIGAANDPSYPQELYVCNERGTDGPLTACANGGSALVTMDVFDPFIWGPFAPFESLREPAIGPALAALTSDIVCIPDAYGDTATKDILAKAGFPYSVHFYGDAPATKIDDPSLEDGGLPPTPTTAPCAGYDGVLDPFLQCLSQYCTAPLGVPDASIIENAGACITNNCAAQAEGLLITQDPQQLKCWNCAFFSVQGGASIADTQSECLTHVNAGYAFDGQSGVSILSRLPAFAPAEQWVLPATNWRASIVRAPWTLPGGGELDAYCVQLSDPSSSLTIPYTGAYGNGATDVTGWNAELAIQTQKVVAYVRAKSVGVPAIIGGELYSGPGAADGTMPIDTFAYQTLAAVFPIAAPPGGPPGCTLCASNPILTPPGETADSTNALTSYVLLANIPVTDVVSATIELKDPVLDAGTTEAGLPYVVPLSTYYDYRATLRVRP